MSDLISRNAVIDIIHKEIERTTSFAEHQTQINIEMAVKELPIAYDVDKVVEELESRICTIDEYDTEISMRNKHYKTAIEIVMQGGVGKDTL